MKGRKGRNRKGGDNRYETTISPEQNLTSSGAVDDLDYSNFSAHELAKNILAISKNPIVAKLLEALLHKVPKEFSTAQEGGRSRTIVISGIEELNGKHWAMERQTHVEDKVNQIFDVLEVECRPVSVYRLGKWDKSQSRLVEVILPSKTYWTTALANGHRLRSAGLPFIHVRRSMTEEERKRESEQI
ncbi:hypothetical protein Y032_0094g2694 [Ancylostoma ceylanicum]|uniref:Uncharacterized protein n=1 Tax=Ancylostoma ceylanicum TaxID=53326 RepID=A0A016TL68_9BILA|nr:hypothetical protein Y032_0094g2694 [Ancylostoma ceylanicum]